MLLYFSNNEFRVAWDELERGPLFACTQSRRSMTFQSRRRFGPSRLCCLRFDCSAKIETNGSSVCLPVGSYDRVCFVAAPRTYLIIEESQYY